MPKNTVINADGSASVTESLPDNPDGSKAFRNWSVPASQIEKHIATWDDTNATQKLTPGDKSALRDAANEYAKSQRGR